MKIVSLNTARIENLLTAQGLVTSAIAKQSRAGVVSVGELGLQGDSQADLSVHGGPRRALYAYPSEHYAFWQTVRAQAGAGAWGEVLPPGALGENLTLAGLLESQVWAGDRLRFADCELIVTEPRQPCFKLNAHLGFKHAVKLMAQSGWCGFYLAVAQAGSLRADESFELLPGPRELSIADMFRS
ncbi:MAG TPA: MOSC domain-containing protein [Burkholderiaceae bacterium]